MAYASMNALLVFAGFSPLKTKPPFLVVVILLGNLSNVGVSMCVKNSMLLCAIVLGTLFCTLPVDPDNINNAGIIHETLTSIPDTIPVNSVYLCTAQVQYPHFIDSFSVIRATESGRTEKIAGGVLGGDSLLTFTVLYAETAPTTVMVLLFKSILVDTLTRNVYVVSTTPTVKPLQNKKRVDVEQACILQFSATDPDSNLLGYLLDVNGSSATYTSFLSSERASALIATTFSAGSLQSLHDSLLVYRVTVLDADSQFSTPACCTLLVSDTISPEITLLLPLGGDSVYIVKKLPQTFGAVVVDNWGVDSVKFAGKRAQFSGGDTVLFVVNKLDSGVTTDTFAAWDRSGKISVKNVQFRYNGEKVYPPQITTIFQTVNEGEQFDTVFLDTKVTITDPDATYPKDSLRWTVVIDSIDSGMVVQYDSLKRLVIVRGPSGELFRDKIVVLSLTVTDSKGVVTVNHGVTFVMVEKNDPPKITLNGQGRLFNLPFDTLKLDTCGFDPEKNAQLSWVVSRGKYFMPDSLYTVRCTGIGGKTDICLRSFTGKVAIIADSSAFAVAPASQSSFIDTLVFTLTSVTVQDTAIVQKKVLFSWSKLFVIKPIELQPIQLK